MRFAFRHLFPLVCLVASVHGTQAAATAEESPWDLAKSFLTREAHEGFVQARGMNERERRLGEAITALNIQPRTQGAVARVRQSLEALAAENPDDDAGILARFLTARILELHQQPSDPAAAAAVYRALVSGHPGHEMAEYALTPLVHLELFPRMTAAERRKKIRSLEALGKNLQTASGRRDFHLAMGYAALDLTGDSTAALRHFLEADQAGITRPETELAVWIHIGELARTQGRPAEAALYYRKLLEKYPRNNATPTIRARLEALTATP